MELTRDTYQEYVHYFETKQDYDNKRNNNYSEPWLSLVEPTNEIDYNIAKEYKEPLTFEILSDGKISWLIHYDTNAGSDYKKTIYYKINDGEWISIRSATSASAPTISVVSGDTVQFRGNNTSYAATYGSNPSYSAYNYFSVSSQCKIKGNIMSLINSTNFANLTKLSSTYTFGYLFSNCTGLTDASELLLPATTLTNYCYLNMFRGCTSLTQAPELPATTLTQNCYASMFTGCNSLTTAPELPATTLAERCYIYMFSDCTSLVNGPSSIGTSATTMTATACTSMFQNCNSLTTAPELPATTLANYCYQYMFSNCSNLNYIKCLATDISATNCTNGWVGGVASSGTFVTPSSTSWSSKTGTDGIPTGWERVDV